MSTATYRELFENCFAGLAKGDPNALWDILDEDIEWTVIGNTFVSGTYHGLAAIAEAILGSIISQLSEPPVLTLKRVIAEGDSAAVELTGSTRTLAGLPYNNVYCWVCDFRNGKVVRLVEYFDTALVTASFGAATCT